MTDAKVANDKLIPPMTECGPESYVCGTHGRKPRWRLFQSCPNHALACAAGPWLMDADNTFRRRVSPHLKIIQEKCEQYWNEPQTVCVEELHAILEFIHREVFAIRDMDDGYMRDCVRRGKGK